MTRSRVAAARQGMASIAAGLLVLTGMPWPPAPEASGEEPAPATPAGEAALAEQPQRLAVPAELLQETIDDYFGIYIDGSKVGWARGQMHSSPAADGGPGSLDFRVQLVVRFDSFGKTIRTYSVMEESYAKVFPHRLLGAREATSQEEQTQSLILEHRGGTDYELVIRSGSREDRRPWTGLDHTLGDSIALDIWCRSPRQAGDRLVAQELALPDMRVEIEHFEVTGVKRESIESVPVTYYEILYRNAGPNLKGLLRYSDKGRMVSVDFDGQMELRLEPKELAQNLDAPVDLFARFLVPSDLALGDSDRIKSMRLLLSGPDVALFKSGPGLTVEAMPDTPGQIRIATGTAAKPSPAATASDIEEALRATVRFPATDETVVALARQAIGNAATDREKVRRLVAFVADYIEDDYSAEPLDVHYVIEQRKGDCTEHTLLLTTLARAAGIPCRDVSGLMYAGDEFQAFGGHAWNEVAIDGHWLPVDATWNQLQVDGTHIRIAHGTDMERGKLLNGRLEIEILSVEPGVTHSP